jgi:hypothetical protein
MSGIANGQLEAGREKMPVRPVVEVERPLVPTRVEAAEEAARDKAYRTTDDA